MNLSLPSSALLTTADQVLNAIGGINAVVAEAARSGGPLRSSLVKTAVVMLLARKKKQASFDAACAAAVRVAVAYSLPAE